MATFPAQVEAWRALIEERAAGTGLPMDFLLKYVQNESFGNPCAQGVPGIEAGIAQTWHPDDDRHGATFAQLREGCSGQSIVTPLSDFQKDRQVKVLISKVTSDRASARSAMSRAGVDWSEDSTDFWCLVKLVHGLPALVTDYLPRAGRPSSWAEFRSYVMSLSEAEVVAINKNVFPWRSTSERARMFDTAEKTGMTVGTPIAGFGLPGFITFEVLAAVAFGVAAYFLAFR